MSGTFASIILTAILVYIYGLAFYQQCRADAAERRADAAEAALARVEHAIDRALFDYEPHYELGNPEPISVGRVPMSVADIEAGLQTLYDDLTETKPCASKGSAAQETDADRLAMLNGLVDRLREHSAEMDREDTRRELVRAIGQAKARGDEPGARRLMALAANSEVSK